jgi:hypothetical protein
MDAELVERAHRADVEVGDRLRLERDGQPRAVGDEDHELVSEEVEGERERPVVVRDGRRLQPARRDQERDVPEVIHARGKSQADLPGDLRPHLQRVARVAPGRERQRRPGHRSSILRGRALL